MLREVESRLEELMAKISVMDPEVLAKGEKEKETERRNRVRVAKYKEQQRQVGFVTTEASSTFFLLVSVLLLSFMHFFPSFSFSLVLSVLERVGEEAT